MTAGLPGHPHLRQPPGMPARLPHPASPCCVCSKQERVIGQDDAVDATARAIMRASSGLKNPSRPIATLLFSGPTGVGKTELTKVGGGASLCGGGRVWCAALSWR